MLQNDIPGMAALDEPIKQAEQDIDNLKIGMGEVMGANVHGPSGNQLTGSGWFGRVMDELSPDGTAAKQADALRAPNMGETPAIGAKPGLHITNGKPLFTANDAKAHVTEVDDKAERIISGESPETDRLKKILEGIRESSKEGKLNEFLKENGLNISALIEIPNKLKMELGVSKFIEYLWNLEEKDEKNTDGPYFEKGGPMFTATPSILNQNNGVAEINGKDIPIAVSNYGGYEDFSGITKDEVSLSFDRRNFWEMISQMKVDGERDETKTTKYNSGQVAVASTAAVVSAAQSMIDTKRHFDIDIKTVNIAGEERVVIEYTDSYPDLIRIFGAGKSTMTKQQANDGSFDGLYYMLDGDYQNIDEKRLNDRVTGNIYVENGRMMVKPFRFMGDQIVRDNQDITTFFFQSFYLDKNAVLLIDTKLKEQGIDLGINLSFYDEE